MYFSSNVSFSSLLVFLPTILEAMGLTSINAQGLSAPPYFLAFLVVLLAYLTADNTSQRGFAIFTLSMVGVLAAAMSVGVRYPGVSVAAAGVSFDWQHLALGAQ
jgi:hypothetical protein